MKPRGIWIQCAFFQTFDRPAFPTSVCGRKGSFHVFLALTLGFYFAMV